MAQNKYLQLLRNSDFAANYEAAVALIEANAPKMDGAPIIVRFTEGEKTHALLGVSYNANGAVNFVELGGERIKDVKEALEAAIEAAKKAATTKVENKADDAHIKVTASEPDTDGAVTYAVEGVDIASASATSASMNALQQEIDALEELVADTKEEITSAYTAADEALQANIDTKIGKEDVMIDLSSRTRTEGEYLNGKLGWSLNAAQDFEFVAPYISLYHGQFNNVKATTRDDNYFDIFESPVISKECVIFSYSNGVATLFESDTEDGERSTVATRDLNQFKSQLVDFHILLTGEIELQNVVGYLVTSGGLNTKDSIEYLKNTKADKSELKANTEAINTLQGEIYAVEEIIGTGFDKDNTVTQAIEDIEGQISALTESSKVTLATSDATTEGYLKTYVISQGGTEVGKIDIPKDLVVTKGEIVEKDGEKYLQLTIANQDAPVEIAVKDLVDVYVGSAYIEIATDNTISVKFTELDAALVAEGTEVQKAIAATQKAGEDAAAAVQSALTSHIAAYDIKVGELEAADKTNADAISALTATHTADKTELEGKISDAEAAANEYADGLKEAVDAYTVNGKAISTNPVLGASDIAVEDATAKFSGETVEAVLAELDDKIKQVQSEALAIEEGVAIEFGANEGKTVINVKVSDTEGNQLQVTENGLFVASDVDYVVEAGNGIEVSEKAEEKQTISVKLNAAADQALTCDADGVYLSNVWDCGTF